MTISNMTVVDRLAEKLKTAEGSAFFGEEDILDLANQAVAQAFFTPGRHEQHAPIVQMMHKHLHDRMTQACHKMVDEWIKENPDKFEETMREAFNQAPEQILMSVFAGMFNPVVMNVKNHMEHMLNEKLGRAVRGY